MTEKRYVLAFGLAWEILSEPFDAGGCVGMVYPRALLVMPYGACDEPVTAKPLRVADVTQDLTEDQAGEIGSAIEWRLYEQGVIDCSITLDDRGLPVVEYWDASEQDMAHVIWHCDGCGEYRHADFLVLVDDGRCRQCLERVEKERKEKSK